MYSRNPLTARPYVTRLVVLLAFILVPHGVPSVAVQQETNWLDEECPAEFSLRGEIRRLLDAPSDSLVTVAFNRVDSSNCLLVEFSRSRATLVRRKSGKSTPLASTAVSPDRRGRIEFTIKRRLWRITLICNGRIVARAYDTKMKGGTCGWRAPSAVSVALQLQPTEPVVFADDFTRSARERTEWETLAGRWAIGEIPVGNYRGKVGRFSPNAFAWVARPEPVAVCVTGYWFWDDYVVESSIRSEGRGAIGVLGFVQEDGDGYLLRLTAAAEGRPGSGVKEILRIQDGRAVTLASAPGGYEPHQWYRLRLIACDGTLSAYIDGDLVCTARDAAFGQGKVGLYAEDWPAIFDDVAVAAMDSFRDAFGDAPVGKWEDVGAVWRTHTSLRHRCMIRPGEGITVAGSPDWEEYSLTADVGTGRADRVGLCFGYTDPRNYSLFCLSTQGAEKARLLRINDGKPSLIAESPLPIKTAPHTRLRLVVGRKVSRAHVNGALAVEGATPFGTRGRIGCYARGGSGARFSNLAVSFPHSEPRARAWWKLADGTLWHVGELAGDCSVRVDIPCQRGGPSSVLAIHADGARLDSGYQLTARLQPDGQTCLDLARNGQSVATASAAVPEDAASLPLCLSSSGSLVVGTLGDALAVSYPDPRLLRGLHVAARVPQPRRTVASLEAGGANVLDCTFARAPVEWWAGRGEWRVTQRWPCDDRFSYFGGLDSESPLLWSKHGFTGDLTVEAWMGLYMDNIADLKVGYRHPSDLNLSICTNGKDLSSGYSFLFAAANNTVTRLLRKERVVMENPRVKMVNAVRTNLAWQRHWFLLRVEKRGNRIRCFVDGQLAAEYVDPEPIRGGQVALWSWRNGLMVARARVRYEDDDGWNPIPVVEAPSSHTGRGQLDESAGPFAGGMAPRWWAYTLGLVPAAPDPLPRDQALVTLAAPSEGWTVSHASPLSLACGFEKGLAGWGAAPSPESPLLTTDCDTLGDGRSGVAGAHPSSARHSGNQPSPGRRCLRVINRVSGGAFAVLCGVDRFDAAKFPVIAFDYRLPSSAKINLYLRVGKQQCMVGLSAPEAKEAGVLPLGPVPGFTADWEWHTARFELLTALRRVLPPSPSVIVEDLCFRAPDVEYLRSGFGGNYWGTEYCLDCFGLEGAQKTTPNDARAVALRR